MKESQKPSLQHEPSKQELGPELLQQVLTWEPLKNGYKTFQMIKTLLIQNLQGSYYNLSR